MGLEAPARFGQGLHGLGGALQADLGGGGAAERPYRELGLVAHDDHLRLAVPDRDPQLARLAVVAVSVAGVYVTAGELDADRYLAEDEPGGSQPQPLPELLGEPRRELAW